MEIMMHKNFTLLLSQRVTGFSEYGKRFFLSAMSSRKVLSALRLDAVLSFPDRNAAHHWDYQRTECWNCHQFSINDDPTQKSEQGVSDRNDRTVNSQIARVAKVSRDTVAKVKIIEDKASDVQKANQLRLYAEARLGELIIREQKEGRLATSDRSKMANNAVIHLSDYGITKEDSRHAKNWQRIKILSPNAAPDKCSRKPN